MSPYFNSHPHEEDDRIANLLSLHSSISTHILTKRMTVQTDSVVVRLDISTHILTKRMTDEDSFETGLAVFQLTSSRRG